MGIGGFTLSFGVRRTLSVTYFGSPENPNFGSPPGDGLAFLSRYRFLVGGAPFADQQLE